MALIDCHYESSVLGMSMSMKVILPQSANSAEPGLEPEVRTPKYPVLYLLHGLSDDHSVWSRRTSLERYAAGYELAIVMPNAHRSFYTDMKQGGRYFTHVSEELPRLVSSFFPVSTAREDTFVAGLSMGGYGAFKLALTCPERFAAAASFSGALDMTALQERWPQEQRVDMERIFGPQAEFAGSENDLFALTDRLIASGTPRPRLYQSCGTEDFLYADNLAFRDHAGEKGLTVRYSERPGSHEWGFWDAEIKETLAWLPLKGDALSGLGQRQRDE